MTPVSGNEKAARRRPFDWVEYRRQFVVYAVFLTAAGLIRMLIGDIRAGVTQFLAWELVYLPLAAIAALFATRIASRPPAVPGKPRILGAILTGLAIAATVVGLCVALR